MEEQLMKTRKRKIVVWIVFAIYLALLIKVILLKYPMSMIKHILNSSEISSLSFRIAHSNFIPFKTILEYLSKSQNMRISVKNILGNIVAFAPFGFLLSLLIGRINKFKSIILSAFVLSLMFEIIQLLTAIGTFDVDDILLNLLGAVLGYLFYQIFMRFIKENK